MPAVVPSSGPSRTRPDRCPGVLRPWPAADGLLVRLRLIGGRLPTASLRALLEVAEAYGDGRVHLTGRANLQLRGLPRAGKGDPALPPAVLEAVARTGLLPTRTHELVRNVMVSPQTGLAGGRADLRPTARDLDRLLCADPRLAGLSGRFLFVLDDGRGDLVARPCDLGLVVLDRDVAQLRVGAGWGSVVRLEAAAEALTALASAFLDRRGAGACAPWHVEELAQELVQELAESSGPLVPACEPEGRVPEPAAPLAFGDVPGGRHVPAPDGLDRARVDRLAPEIPEVVVTPWRGVVVPEGTR